jgi:hypothetical protein
MVEEKLLVYERIFLRRTVEKKLLVYERNKRNKEYYSYTAEQLAQW